MRVLCAGRSLRGGAWPRSHSQLSRIRGATASRRLDFIPNAVHAPIYTAVREARDTRASCAGSCREHEYGAASTRGARGSGGQRALERIPPARERVGRRRHPTENRRDPARDRTSLAVVRERGGA